MAPPDVESADGSSCKIWTGLLQTRSGRTAKLRKAWATGKRAVTTITYRGPVYACGVVLPRVVTRASVLRTHPRHT
jgi:hypothetical protein